ncbi:MAG: aminoacyl-histidine dipeptidase [Bacteroidales bacterium]|nr:aminoacyl-histidine dipeptidase [Bacteroidales bacterium]MBN2821141.1 aminoacyl-histidine dipeptidase [Bacteroidales bacterium]
MGKEIADLEPKILWKHFYSLTQIPRPSGHEQKVIEFIIAFAKEHKLEYVQDKVGNLIVRKQAAKGKEKIKTVVLQSHVDMVPQKNSNKKHDFEKDPIETIIDGEWLKAKETTLGADNGIGVAAILAVLESSDILHGPIEALFTINEEAGMEGAFGLKPGILKGGILLNLDSEDEGELFVGCAGGIDVEAITTYKEELAPLGQAHDISVSGLKGGHSGLDINLGRANANKILGRFLWSAHNNFPLKIAKIKGGDLRNAIPREAHASIIIPEKHEHDFRKFFEQFAVEVKNEYKHTEPGMILSLNPAGAPEMVCTDSAMPNLLSMLNAAIHGPVRMSDVMPGVVETSLNLAIVDFSDGQAKMIYLLRSFLESAKYALAEQVASLHQVLGCQVDFDGDYPGWQPNADSAILKTMKAVYKDDFGKEPAVKAIHAGLECGIIGSKYPEMDMISFGPTIRFPHSPDEKVKIDTVDKFWKYLKVTLESIH